MSFLLVLLGLALLVAGAQLLVRGASKLAVAIGISPLVVGLTVVAFGTSAPELAVSIRSCLADQTRIVLGNVIGSNIYNVLLILGVSALLKPLIVSRQLIWLDVPLMIGASLLFWFLGLDGHLTRIEGTFFFCGIVAYTVFLVVKSRKTEAARPKQDTAPAEQQDRRWWLHLLLIIAGLVLLTVGSNFLVDGAVSVARTLGVSELLIAMTVVTIGTTSPELTASLVATFRGERDIAVGNIVGSNIFNILSVLGVGAILAPHGITVEPQALAFGIPVLNIAAVACLPVFFAGHAIRRWEGAMFLLYFGVYLTRLILETKQSPLCPAFDTAILFYLAPVTLIAIIVSVIRQFRQEGRTGPAC